ncbi:tyrosine-type recombinase/integrase [Burkholderia sp. BE12]|uniref:tyrosine-type recombinase/integrase n=1 Tax=Burkholderia sp. BE12 TaxID=2082394 RepID=UPI000CF46E45|nr:integrase arm-type DNA-binding domain-containing protein [Burkholderia sp. BE12]
MRFDARAVKQMSPGAHLTFDEFPGLRLKATASRRSWIYRYKSPVDGLMRQVKLGSWPTMSYAAAIAAWESARTQRGTGFDHQLTKRASRQKTAAPAAYTVKQLCMDYIGGYVEPRRAAKNAASISRRLLGKTAAIADLPAASITRKQVFDLLQESANAPRNAAALRADLGAAWDYALDAGRLPDTTPNWWRMVMKGKLQSVGRTVAGKRVVAKRVLSNTEIPILLGWVSNFDAAIRDVLVLYLWTALRGAELVAIEGRAVTEEADGLWWTIPKEKTKNRRRSGATDHRVPLIGRAEAIVRARKKLYGDGHLFPNLDPEAELPHVEQRDVQQAVWERQPYANRKPATEQLPVTHWAPHDLRRTARTQLAALGCPREVGEAIVGHLLPGVEGIYNRHTYDAEKRVWLTRLADHLESLVR